MIGATGFIGRHFYKTFKGFYDDIIGTTRDPKNVSYAYLDLRRPDYKGLKLAETGHKAAVLLAAESNVGRCEQYPRNSNAVNVLGMKQVIDGLVEEGMLPIFLSTDYVFDGVKGDYTEEDPTEPTTLYGKQKLEIEHYLKEKAGDEYLILRLSKIFSLEKGNGILLDEMAALFHEDHPVMAAYDQCFNPLHIGDLIRALLYLLDNDLRGTWHICGDQAMPRYEMAKALAAAMGKPESLVQRISLDQLGSKPARPKNTSMNNARFRAVYTPDMVTIEDYIKRIAANWA